MYLADDFRHQLRRHDLRALDRMDLTALAIRPDGTIAYLNDGWFRFAAEHGAKDPARVWDPARPILEAIPAALRPFYGQLFGRVLASRQEQTHDYVCPTPDAYRRYHLRVVPLDRGLLLLHHLDVERPAPGGTQPLEYGQYRSAAGIVVQCAHCRMVRRVGDGETWDWVPAWVEHPDEHTSHGLCPVCFALHYPALAERYVVWRGEMDARVKEPAPDAERHPLAS
jgi:hypothetical protein